MRVSDRIKIVLLTLFAILAISKVWCQEKINWLTWDEAIALNKLEPRKIIVDVYTDWCGWCKKMDKATFQDSAVVRYVNQNYYAIKFNAEQTDDIRIGDQVYQYVKKGTRGYHELAAQITYGRLSYPTIVFMSEKLEVIQPLAGFQAAEDFEMIMKYFGGDFHKTTPWKKYAASYTR